MFQISDFNIVGNSSQLDVRYAAFLEQVNQRLQSWKGYVAIAPYGSYLKGYHCKGSDFDLCMIGTRDLEKEFGYMDLEVVKMARTSGWHGHIVGASHAEDIEEELTCGGTMRDYSVSLYNIAFPFMGNMELIERLRALAKVRHGTVAKLNKGFAMTNVQDAAIAMVESETGIRVHALDGEVCGYKLIPSGLETTVKISTRIRHPQSVISFVKARFDFWFEKFSTVYPT